VYHKVVLDTHVPVTAGLVLAILDEEQQAIRAGLGEEAYADSRFDDARTLFERVALADEFVDFLTLPAYELID
jgi:malate synthase